MSRKQYRMEPSLYLEAGPDRFHPGRVGPLTTSELFALAEKSPADAYAQGYATDASEEAKREGDLLHDAVIDWNSTFSDEDGSAYVKGWRWLGIAVKATCDELDVWCSIMGPEKVLTVGVNDAAIESEARTAALEAFKVLSKVMRQGGNS